MASKPRTSVLADGTTVDQDYFQSKNYILEQLAANRGGAENGTASKSGAGSSKSTKERMNDTTANMVKSGAVSADDGWLLTSMEAPLRNPFCVANHPAPEQFAFYQKVMFVSAVFMFFVAVSTMLWAWWWKALLEGGLKPILPCKGIGKAEPFGKMRWCNSTSTDGNTALNEDGCDEGAPLSVCVEDACFNSEDDIRDCWSLAAMVMVIFAAYMLLLFRRDVAGKGLLSCACFIEGILGGAATLHYDSSVFVEFFTYLTSVMILTLAGFTWFGKKQMPEWEKLPNQVGSAKMDVPEVEKVIFAAVKKVMYISTAIVVSIAFIWHFGNIARLTGGSTAAFIVALLTLLISIVWIVREMSWTQHKYDTDQYVNMCISFHVDLYCLFILFTLFAMFVLNDSCQSGVQCPMTCGYMCAVQGERCARFTCGFPGSGGTRGDSAAAAAEATSKSAKAQSMKVQKEVETEEQYKKKKMINAGCAVGIISLGFLCFVAAPLAFAIALGLCIFMPFFRAKMAKDEDHSNV